MTDVTGIRGVRQFEKEGKDSLAYVQIREGVPKAVVVSALLIQTCTSNVMHVPSFTAFAELFSLPLEIIKLVCIKGD